MKTVVPGVYRHFQGDILLVLGVAQRLPGGDAEVIYHKAGQAALYACPVSLWQEELPAGQGKVYTYIAATPEELDKAPHFSLIEELMRGIQCPDLKLCFYYCREDGQLLMLEQECLALAAEGKLNREQNEGILYDAQTVLLALDILQCPQKYIPAPDARHFNEYAAMEAFAASLNGAKEREKLLCALDGKGAFRRFKGTVRALHLEQAWYAFRDRECRKCCRLWCEENALSWGEYVENPGYTAAMGGL